MIGMVLDECFQCWKYLIGIGMHCLNNIEVFNYGEIREYIQNPFHQFFCCMLIYKAAIYFQRCVVI